MTSGEYSSVSGGESNTASGNYSSAFGGQGAVVHGLYSTGVAGGSTGADAQYGLAAGYQSVVTVANGTAIGYQATSSLQLLSRLLIAPSQCLQGLEQCA